MLDKDVRLAMALHTPGIFSSQCTDHGCATSKFNLALLAHRVRPTERVHSRRCIWMYEHCETLDELSERSKTLDSYSQHVDGTAATRLI